MNGDRALARSLAQQVSAGVVDLDVDVALFPPFVYLAEVIGAVSRPGSSMLIGGQNLAVYREGAYTGEVSGGMLADVGCAMVLVGHSERRTLFGESSMLVAEKVEKALDCGLTPVLCVGETLEQRENGVMESVLREQLDPVLSRLGVAQLREVVVAYEPVWAIGTGVTASPEQAQNAHAFVRQVVAEASQEVATTMKILYGGSVKAENAGTLFSMPDIDGGLVGGASLEADGFIEICRAAVE